MLQQEGAVQAALIAGTRAVLWNDPETYLGTVPVPVALEYVPQEVWCQLMVPGGVLGFVTIVPASITALGCTLLSTSIGPGGDTSTYRVYARCRPQRTM